MQDININDPDTLRQIITRQASLLLETQTTLSKYMLGFNQQQEEILKLKTQLADLRRPPPCTGAKKEADSCPEIVVEPVGTLNAGG